MQTATGDTIVSSKSSALAAARRAERDGEKKHRPNSEVERLVLAGVEIPEPVFFCTIEPPSVAKQPGTNYSVCQLGHNWLVLLWPQQTDFLSD